MLSDSVYPITALIKPLCFPSDIVSGLRLTLMGSALTVSTAHFTQQHPLMHRPIREQPQTGSVLIKTNCQLEWAGWEMFNVLLPVCSVK